MHVYFLFTFALIQLLLCESARLWASRYQPWLEGSMSSEDVWSSCVAHPQLPPVSVLFHVAIAVLFVDPYTCMCSLYVLQRPSLNNFLSPLQSSWSVLSLLVFLVSAHARLLTVFCCHRCPLRRSSCLHVLPIPSNHLSLYCLLSPHLSFRCFHVLPVPSHRPSL